VSEVTGVKSELSRKARAGRVVAALYQFESALRNSASRRGTALLEVRGKTAAACGLCGGSVAAREDDHQTLHCASCGGVFDRKKNGAAITWVYADAVRESIVDEYWTGRIAGRESRLSEAKERLAKMAASRASNRQAAQSVNITE
jgi:hypothetical protein